MLDEQVASARKIAFTVGNICRRGGVGKSVSRAHSLHPNNKHTTKHERSFLCCKKTTTLQDPLVDPETGRRPTLAEKGNFAEKRDGGVWSRLLFALCGDRHRSYLEHITDHNDATRNGIHYPGWLDALFNVTARPPLIDLKMALITL
jgi:hypothetical protein